MKRTERQAKSVKFAHHYKIKGIFKYYQPTMTIDGKFTFFDYHHFIITKTDDVIVYLWDTREVIYRTVKSNLANDFIYAKHLDSYEPLIGYRPNGLRADNI